MRKYIMADDKARKYDDEGFDSDLDRTMYQEFWAELRDYKKPPPVVDNRARSVADARPDGMSMAFQGGPGSLATLDGRTYGTTPKGISGPLGGIVDAFKPSFAINVQDPYSPQHREINAKYLKPREGFDSVFEEYVHKRKMIDNVKKGMVAAAAQMGDDDEEGGAGGGDNKQAQIDALNAKIAVI